MKPTQPLGMWDETEGYRAQYAYDPNSLVGYSGNYAGIDWTYAGTAKDSNGQYVYPQIRAQLENKEKTERQNAREAKKAKKAKKD